jgi:hypothetical protein
VSLNGRLDKLERILEHWTAHQRQAANLHVLATSEQPLTEEELCERDATEQQRQLLEQTEVMDATIPDLSSSVAK